MKAKLSNLVALDIGSSKIIGLAAYIDKKGEAKILSQTIHHSNGIKSGLITDLKAAENSILGAIYPLEKDCEKNIKQVTVSLSGAGTKSYFLTRKIKLSNQQVTKEDVKKLIQKALAEFKIKDQEIIHYFPLEFCVDDNHSIEDPVGMFAKELSCQLHIIAVNSGLIMNLTNCLARCQIEINNVVLSIYAASIACLFDDEMNLGSLIIDIGARTTSFCVFYSGKLIYTGHVTIGSDHITSDIAKIFSISLFAAEKLKVLYGSAAHTTFDKNNPIVIDDVESDHNYNPNLTITSKQLSEVIQARVEEILLQIKEQYDKAEVDHLIARRLIITGGGSMLRGIKELATNIFEKQVRIAKPLIVPGFTEDHNPAMYSTAIGMVKNYAIKQQKKYYEINPTEKEFSWLKRAVLWIKENL